MPPSTASSMPLTTTYVLRIVARDLNFAQLAHTEATFRLETALEGVASISDLLPNRYDFFRLGKWY